MRRSVATSPALLTGFLLACLSGPLSAPGHTSRHTSQAQRPEQAPQTVSKENIQSLSIVATKQILDDVPGRAPVEPVEFPTDSPADPLESLSEQLPMEAPAEASVETPPNTPTPRPVTAWRIFTSEVGQFRVAMPSPPAIYTLFPESIDDSRMYMQMQLVNASQLEIYAAAFVVLPGSAGSGEALDLALRGCIENVSDWPLQTEPAEITLGEYRGLEAEVQTADGFQVSRCYLVGDDPVSPTGYRAYMLTATSEAFDPGSGLMPLSPASAESETLQEQSPEHSPEHSQEHSRNRSSAMEAFFNSFEILEASN
ncbi:MAG: hypothetical protein AAGL08_05220 [Cyanobacteria bacterium J06573_11]